MGPTDPISGGATSIVAAIGTTIGGFSDLPVETLKILGVHPGAKKKKEESKDGKASKSDLALPLTSTNTNRSSDNVSLASHANGSETKSQIYLGSDDGHSIADTAGSGTSASTRLGAVSDSGASMTTITSAESERTIGMETAATASDTDNGNRERSLSMVAALSALPESSRPQSASRGGSPARGHSGSTSSTFVPTVPFKPEAALDTVYGTGKGISKIIGAGLKSPMDFTMAITKGFHNVPRLYGEEPRHIPRVTGFQSGLKTAGKEFGVGLYDGITGLVTQPVTGAKQGGAGGFLKGLGRGIAGIVVKPSAAAYALPAYAMQGVYKEIQKRLGENVGSYIIAARVAQGYGEWIGTDDATRRDIIHHWAARLAEVKGKRGLGKNESAAGGAGPGGGLGAIKAFVDKRKDQRINNLKEKATLDECASPLTPWQSRTQTSQDSATLSPSSGSVTMNDHTTMAPDIRVSRDNSEPDDTELEEAIRLSLRAEEAAPSATGVPPDESEHDLELKKAISASLEQMKLVDEEHEEKEFNNAIAESAKHYAENRARWEADATTGQTGASVMHNVEGLSEEEQVKRAIAESEKHASKDGADGDSDADLAEALQESKRVEEEDRKKRHEEETVLEYVRKQSLAEAEYKRQHLGSSSNS